MALVWPPKDPDELLDYRVDWGARLLDDVISASVWEVPAGISGSPQTFTDDTTTIWLSGGTLHETYSFVNRVQTTGGRVMDQTVRIKIKAK